MTLDQDLIPCVGVALSYFGLDRVDEYLAAKLHGIVVKFIAPLHCEMAVNSFQN